MKIIYISTLLEKEYEKKIFEVDRNAVGIQAQKYHRLVYEGLVKNKCDVIPVTKVEKRFERYSNSTNFRYIFTNSKLIAFFRSFFFYTKMVLKNKDIVFVCDPLCFSLSFSAVICSKIFRKKIVGIVTDFPEYLAQTGNAIKKLIWMVLNNLSGYILITKQMNEKLKPKPFVVIEGLVDAELGGGSTKEKKPNYSNRVLMYAGTLDKRYGIDNLIKGFIQSHMENTELHIYGNGDYSEYLASLKNDSVKFFGVVDNDVVMEREKEATLLINPRPSCEEFTRYSFPSKNMEYMVSGTPLLTTKLPGMPDEYLNYVFLINSENPRGISDSLSGLLSLDKNVLKEKGNSAKMFVLENKNNLIQTKKIIDFINNLENCRS